MPYWGYPILKLCFYVLCLFWWFMGPVVGHICPVSTLSRVSSFVPLMLASVVSVIHSRCIFCSSAEWHSPSPWCRKWSWILKGLSWHNRHTMHWIHQMGNQFACITRKDKGVVRGAGQNIAYICAANVSACLWALASFNPLLLPPDCSTSKFMHLEDWERSFFY